MNKVEEVWADIWHLEVHHSTALEGNTLVLREVETLLDHGKVVAHRVTNFRHPESSQSGRWARLYRVALRDTVVA